MRSLKEPHSMTDCFAGVPLLLSRQVQPKTFESVIADSLLASGWWLHHGRVGLQESDDAYGLKVDSVQSLTQGEILAD